MASLDQIDSALKDLVLELKKLPGIGEKTASRLAFFILRQPKDFAFGLAGAIQNAREQLHSCSECCNFSETPLCAICSDPNRSDESICEVEGPSDLSASEKVKQFKGKYHVLQGALSPLDGMDETKRKIAGLQARLQPWTYLISASAAQGLAMLREQLIAATSATNAPLAAPSATPPGTP